MDEKRQYNLSGFITDTLAPLVANRVPSTQSPVLGIDEGLNNDEHVGSMCQRLVQCGSGVVPIFETTS
jgi:hypothetical protein